MSDPKWGTEEWYRAHPIHKVDFSKHPADLIEEIRDELVKLRGQLGDISFGYKGFADEVNNAVGSLTCIISYLYNTKNEMEKCHFGKEEWQERSKKAREHS